MTARPGLAPPRYLAIIEADGVTLGRICREHPDQPVPTCPGWTGADLLVHVTAFARWLTELYAGTRSIDTEPPALDPADAARTWDDVLAHLLDVLGSTDPHASVPNWSILPDHAAFWLRRSALDLAVHRVDAQLVEAAATGRPDSPRALPADLASDGIDEYLDAFVATAFAVGAAPAADATLRLEQVDLGRTVSADLPRPGPVTLLRGTASDLQLALWHRRDPLDHFVDGDRERVANWPRI